jgi:predicted DNA-binding protein with PD1-like motif
MQTALLNTDDGLRTYAVIFDKGDEPHSGLQRFAEEEQISAASLTAVGAFSSATLGYFDRDRMDYDDIPVDEQVEVLSMVGDIALSDEQPEVHAHLVVGKRDGSTMGGHLRSAQVWPTLEVIVTETPAHLRKRHDRETGLTLIDPELTT